jgi:hypothetical protein
VNGPFYVVQFRTRCGCTREVQFDTRPPETWRLPMTVDPHILRRPLGDGGPPSPFSTVPFREFRFLREEPMSPPWETRGQIWRLIYEEVGTYGE